MNGDQTFTILSRLLDDEYHLIKAAKFSDLVGLVEEKKVTLECLSDGHFLSILEIEELKEKANRNAELINGAILGFKKSLDTFIGRNASHNSVKTYASNGDVSRNENGLSRIIGYF